jgi:predicted PurR-regulated permease PerM
VPMKASVGKFSEQLPGYWERLQKPLIKIEKQAVLSEEKLQAEVTTEIAEEATAAGKPDPTAATAPPQLTTESGSLRSGLSQMLQGVAGSFRAVAFNAAQMFVVLVTVFFGVVFTLMNPRPIFGAMFSLVPERHHDQALIIMQRIGKFVPGWAGATLLGMLTIGLLVFLLMWPIFGFTDALVLGLIAGVLEAVPFLGPLLAAVPALLLALGKGGMTPLWVVLAYAAVQALENNVIFPLIMARGMKLHPVAVIFSMLLCVAAFGVLGVLVAAPLVAIVSILHDELYRKRFLPTATDADLDRLARKALREKLSDNN